MEGHVQAHSNNISCTTGSLADLT